MGGRKKERGKTHFGKKRSARVLGEKKINKGPQSGENFLARSWGKKDKVDRQKFREVGR